MFWFVDNSEKRKEGSPVESLATFPVTYWRFNITPSCDFLGANFVSDSNSVGNCRSDHKPGTRIVQSVLKLYSLGENYSLISSLLFLVNNSFSTSAVSFWHITQSFFGPAHCYVFPFVSYSTFELEVRFCRRIFEAKESYLKTGDKIVIIL